MPDATIKRSHEDFERFKLEVLLETAEKLLRDEQKNPSVIHGCNNPEDHRKAPSTMPHDFAFLRPTLDLWNARRVIVAAARVDTLKQRLAAL